MPYRQPEQFKVPIAKPAKLGPEHTLTFWHPGRFGVQFAPDSFRDRLHSDMGYDLEATWNPIMERWQLWMRSNQNRVGWKLLFNHNGPSGEHLPLDERVFARLFAASAARWGSGRKYMDHILAQMERDKEAYEKKATQDAIDAAMPYYDHGQISVSGCGHSNGSKFADYLA